MKIIFLTLFFFSNTYAQLLLDVTVTNKKGIDKGLILKNELHSTEEFLGKSPVTLEMKDHIKVDLYAQIIPDYGILGPSSLVWVNAKIFDIKGNLLKDFLKTPLLVPLGKEKQFIFRHEELGQSIEINVKPHYH